MTHIYEGAPDARQAAHIAPSVFRPRYRALSDEEKALHDAIKAKAEELLDLFNKAADLRYPRSVEALGELLVPAPGRYEKHSLGDMSIELGVIGDDYFGWGRKDLQSAVMWTVKGLTS
jgi:hypothetical protein